MRFATIALFASSAIAGVIESTVTSIEEITIYSCAPTVTDCPYRTSTSTIPAASAVTTAAAVTTSPSAPVYSPSTFSSVYSNSSRSSSVVYVAPSAPVSSPAGVILPSTVVPVISTTPAPVVPVSSPSGVIVVSSNATVPIATAVPTAAPSAVLSGATTLQGSVFIAAAAALAAFLI